MVNPWLEIPLWHYEAHMSDPGIAQAPMLVEELLLAVERHDAKSVAVVGCAGGNGFHQLRATGIERAVGIDINPTYIEAVRRRHGHWTGLELHIADVQEPLPTIAPVDLVYAALIFEYVDVAATLDSLATLGGSTGWLVVVLQLPSSALPTVSASPYRTLDALAPVMQLRTPQELRDAASAAGLKFVSERTVTLPSGKPFAVLDFTQGRVEESRGLMNSPA
jgi:trans-aconitate methyltransferase